MKRTLGEVGVQPGGHAKVFNNGRTGVEVEPGRPKEGNHVIGIHGSTMPKTRAGEVREHTIGSRLLDHQVQHIHDRVKEKGG
jgi:hypothetical protein